MDIFIHISYTYKSSDMFKYVHIRQVDMCILAHDIPDELNLQSTSSITKSPGPAGYIPIYIYIYIHAYIQ